MSKFPPKTNRLAPLLAVLMLNACVVNKLGAPVEDSPNIYGYKTPPVPKPNFIVHRVQYPSETLPLIAGWYTGKPANWPQLIEATPWLASETVNAGDVVLVPKSIAVQTMPPKDGYLERGKEEQSVSLRGQFEDLEFEGDDVGTEFVEFGQGRPLEYESEDILDSPPVRVLKVAPQSKFSVRAQKSAQIVTRERPSDEKSANKELFRRLLEEW